jgi:RNA recognition motif-containing protein
MAVRLFVGNLSYDATEAELKAFFAVNGTEPSVRIPTDRETGKPRGFAFVEFYDPSLADLAVTRFNGAQFKGRMLAVNLARPKGEAPPPRESRPSSPSLPSPRLGDMPVARPDRPRRNFGPDAPPKGKRKVADKRRSREERAPRPAVRERNRGRIDIFDIDDLQDDTALQDDTGTDQL